MSKSADLLKTKISAIRELTPNRTNINKLKSLIEDCIDLVNELEQGKAALVIDQMLHTLYKEVHMADGANTDKELIESFKEAQMHLQIYLSSYE